jgi:hypothetical protein
MAYPSLYPGEHRFEVNGEIMAVSKSKIGIKRKGQFVRAKEVWKLLNHHLLL